MENFANLNFVVLQPVISYYSELFATGTIPSDKKFKKSMNFFKKYIYPARLSRIE